MTIMITISVSIIVIVIIVIVAVVVAAVVASSDKSCLGHAFCDAILCYTIELVA